VRGRIGARTAEKQRVEKPPEGAQIKVSVLAADIFGTSGRDMPAAPVAGERNPAVPAQPARTRMRTKINVLEEAFICYSSRESIEGIRGDEIKPGDRIVVPISHGGRNAFGWNPDRRQGGPRAVRV
jgi:hypothetical protein